jgi:hypothetical protein
MANATGTTCFRFWLWLIAFIGVIVPRRLAPIGGRSGRPSCSGASNNWLNETGWMRRTNWLCSRR